MSSAPQDRRPQDLPLDRPPLQDQVWNGRRRPEGEVVSGGHVEPEPEAGVHILISFSILGVKVKVARTRGWGLLTDQAGRLTRRSGYAQG